MAWIELHQSVFTHRKTIGASLLLEIPPICMVGHLAALWTWALDNAPDCTIRTTADVIEGATYWTGESGALVEALTEVGFLHAVEEGWEIHDWYAYAGRLMERREQNAARMRRVRAEKKTERKSACTARAPATVPNPTVPYQTEPEEREYTPALRTLYEAYRLQRHPDSPSHLWTPAEWNKAQPWLTLLVESDATPETVTQATKAALARWKHAGQVTVKAIAEHWTELLEPEPIPRETPSPSTAPPSSSVRLTPSERRAAEWEVRTQRELERQLAAFDDWAAARNQASPDGDSRHKSAPVETVLRPMPELGGPAHQTHPSGGSLGPDTGRSASYGRYP